MTSAGQHTWYASNVTERFSFGLNWRKFLDSVSPDSIRSAESSLEDWLGDQGIAGRGFLDAGCGSGLTSLAAFRLGAKPYSFDFDEDSVHCAEELRRIWAPNSPEWRIEQGSILDEDYVASLGTFDIVCSWGVLHHTGDLWRALELLTTLVGPQGRLWISLYHDAGRSSRMWGKVKRAYVRHPSMRPALVSASFARCWGPTLARDLARGRPLQTWKGYGSAQNGRGMSAWTDLVDWVGGWPFEPSQPGDVHGFVTQRGLQMIRMRTGPGARTCDEYLFMRPPVNAEQRQPV
jgi:2-polyprenyl-3-methyl-5-hydroxy-6-metoxy-1,4-benzoquinol methylase